VCGAKGAGEADTFVGSNEEGTDGEWTDIIVVAVVVGGGTVDVIRKTTGGKIETIYEVIECVESFGGEDAPWLLLLLALLICHGAKDYFLLRFCFWFGPSLHRYWIPYVEHT